MVKRKLTATYAGQTFTRTTDRNYTDVIIQKFRPDSEWEAVSWATSFPLAMRRLSQFTGEMGHYPATKIIPVDKRA